MTKPPKKAVVEPRSPSLAAVLSLQRLFGKNVRKYRIEAGLTQRGLAAAAGMSHRHLSLIELSGANVTIETIVVLARCVHKAPVELLTRAPTGVTRKI